MYMSVSDQYFWEFVLVISIGITFTFWYIKHYIETKMKEQYRLGFYEGYDQGWYTCRDIMWDTPDEKN